MWSRMAEAVPWRLDDSKSRACKVYIYLMWSWDVKLCLIYTPEILAFLYMHLPRNSSPELKKPFATDVNLKLEWKFLISKDQGENSSLF